MKTPRLRLCAHSRQHYSQIDELMTRYKVQRCVIHALPEIQATRGFATRFPGQVFVNYFLESQRGAFPELS